MKRLGPFLGAVVLFVASCVGVNLHCKNQVIQKQEVLTYYNTDSRNFSLTAMAEVLNDDTIAVFGSSELSASDDVAYPPSLFQNGNSDFNMILIGRGSMQSLHHAISVGALASEIPNKKAVLIVSPQWFTSSHLSSEAYASRFSERMYVEFLRNNAISYETKVRVNERVKSLMSSDAKQLERIEKYEKIYLKHTLNPITYVEMGIYNWFMDVKQNYTLSKEIEDYSVNHDEDIVKSAEIDWSSLLYEAITVGEAECTNNSFYIYDDYYNQYVKDALETRRGGDKTASYLVSPEYNDFRLFLEVCKETGISPLVVNIPVNGLWYDWTEFPKEDREAYYQNIRNICAEYEVEMADFADKEYEEYFLKDIMHLGWKGWVYLDEAVYNFYKQDMQ